MTKTEQLMLGFSFEVAVMVVILRYVDLFLLLRG